MEAELVLEVGAENSDKAGRCQQASTLKRRLETLTLKLSGCVKYFADEAAWAITNHSMCDLWIERKEFQPLFRLRCVCQKYQCEEFKCKQIGWVREDDKPLFLEFSNSTDDIEE